MEGEMICKKTALDAITRETQIFESSMGMCSVRSRQGLSRHIRTTERTTRRIAVPVEATKTTTRVRTTTGDWILITARISRGIVKMSFKSARVESNQAGMELEADKKTTDNPKPADKQRRTRTTITKALPSP
jgi:hypothetical protein